MNKLNLLQKSPTDLLESFLWELSEQQKNLDLDSNALSRSGSLQISLGYLIDKEEVEISVIEARDLMARGQL